MLFPILQRTIFLNEEVVNHQGGVFSEYGCVILTVTSIVAKRKDKNSKCSGRKLPAQQFGPDPEKLES